MYPPPEFSGGLLGDQMGLGKTLSIIALIVSNRAKRSRKRQRASHARAQEVKTTLIVAPMSCMSFLIFNFYYYFIVFNFILAKSVNTNRNSVLDTWRKQLRMCVLWNLDIKKIFAKRCSGTSHQTPFHGNPFMATKDQACPPSSSAISS